MKYDNFKKTVPESLQDKIHDLAQSIDFHMLISGHQESIAEQEINPIEGNYREGWMPSQDGGFSVDQFYYNSSDATYHFTQKQSDFMEDQYKECLGQFLAYRDIEIMDWTDSVLCDMLYEFELEWVEPALLQFQVFVERRDRWDDSSPMQVVCRLSINYKDAAYYREKHAEDIKQEIYDIDEFMQLENDAIIEAFKI